MKYRIQITSTNPKVEIRTKDRLYGRNDYYDLLTLHCNRLWRQLEMLMNGETLTENDKKVMRWYIYEVHERRKDCYHHLQIRTDGDRKPIYELNFGVK